MKNKFGLLILVILLLVQSVFAVSNVQQSADGNKITLTYVGSPPFLINIRGDKNIGQPGGYLWAKTYSNTFTYDMGFANNPSKTFYYGVKDASWSGTTYFILNNPTSVLYSTFSLGNIEITLPDTYKTNLSNYKTLQITDKAYSLLKTLTGVTPFNGDKQKITFNQGSSIGASGNPIIISTSNWNPNPPWSIIFHELSHNVETQEKYYNLIPNDPDMVLFSETFATLGSLYVFKNLQNDPSIQSLDGYISLIYGNFGLTATLYDARNSYVNYNNKNYNYNSLLDRMGNKVINDDIGVVGVPLMILHDNLEATSWDNYRKFFNVFNNMDQNLINKLNTKERKVTFIACVFDKISNTNKFSNAFIANRFPFDSNFCNQIKSEIKISDNLLAWPIDCVVGQTCGTSMGYPDIDNDRKSFNCNPPNIAGHTGTDIGISWSQMDAGVNVYAALDGEVLWVFDGKYDRCPNNSQPDCQNPTINLQPGESSGTTVCTDMGNYCSKNNNGVCYWCFAGANTVVLLHNKDKIFITNYGHLKKGSILVKKGDHVVKGQKIAEVGSSGSSSGPHLHFDVWEDYWKPIDPWKGPCNSISESLFEKQP